MAPIHTQARKVTSTTPASPEAHAFLHDLAFVLKLTRQVSDEIRGEHKPVNRIAALEESTTLATAGR